MENNKYGTLKSSHKKMDVVKNIVCAWLLSIFSANSNVVLGNTNDNQFFPYNFMMENEINNLTDLLKIDKKIKLIFDQINEVLADTKNILANWTHDMAVIKELYKFLWKIINDLTIMKERQQIASKLINILENDNNQLYSVEVNNEISKFAKTIEAVHVEYKGISKITKIILEKLEIENLVKPDKSTITDKNIKTLESIKEIIWLNKWDNKNDKAKPAPKKLEKKK